MKYVNNKKGSSSILVILTFMMLVIFSILVMMSSYSDYKLSQKNAYFTKEYYKLTAIANQYWFKADSIVSQSSSNNMDALIEELNEFDENAKIDSSDKALFISKNFKSNDKELMMKLEYDIDNKSLHLLTLKEIPKEFEYKNVDFEDVEVYIE